MSDRPEPGALVEVRRGDAWVRAWYVGYDEEWDPESGEEWLWGDWFVDENGDPLTSPFEDVEWR
jgi:hypothetical protein